MSLIGYARVSTGEQDLAPQLDALRAAGCAELFEEHASGASRARPQLAAALARVRRGDTLVVARIDRLARSLAHLLQVVEGLRARGAHFRSLADPIDTAGPSGVLVLQMLGAVAEFERALIRERTKAGLRAAKARGRVGGNPGLRAGEPQALRKLADARRAGRLADLLPGLDEWLPLVPPAQAGDALAGGGRGSERSPPSRQAPVHDAAPGAGLTPARRRGAGGQGPARAGAARRPRAHAGGRGHGGAGVEPARHDAG